MEYDIIIIGGGPAGLTSAIYTARADFDTLILDRESETVNESIKIENFFGFPSPITKKDLLKKGQKQAEKFGAQLKKDEALLIETENKNYKVETASENVYRCVGLILAPGIKYQKPSIGKLEEYEGRGVSYCVTCDGPFYRGQKVGVLGSKDYAAREVLELSEYSDRVTIYTDGEELKIKDNLKRKITKRGIPVNKNPISKVFGKEKLEGLVLDGGGKEELEGLFVAVGVSGCMDFARSLGVPVKGETIRVDEDLSTGLERLYAAGDCTGGPRQIATAVGEGAKAALELIEDLRNE